MPYRWKPNKAQKEAYKSLISDMDNYTFIRPNGAIRTGCEVSYYSKSNGYVVHGVVLKHSYGALTGQHTFTIQAKDHDRKYTVKGRNLYSTLISHTPGKESIETE